LSINIVLDIHDVLCTYSKTSEVDPHGDFFQNHGAVLSAFKTHYVFPGVIELLKVLFQAENFKVSFFNEVPKQFNVLLVKQLFEIASRPKYPVRVLSFEDLKEHYEKDISQVLSEGDLLENAILIDVQQKNVADGQIKNYLQVEGMTSEKFSRLSLEMDPSQVDGARRLKCYLVTGKLLATAKYIKEGGKILIFKKDKDYEIGFFDQDNVYKVEKFPPDKYWECILLLDRINPKNRCFGKEIRNLHVIECIYEFVASCGGQTREICFQANRICYITGLLFTALSQSKEKNISVSEALLQLQYRLRSKVNNGHKYQCNIEKLQNTSEYYFVGLKKLREVNPNFQFVTPQVYHKCVHFPVKEDVCVLL
jgi:hypothetical protein